MAFLLRPSAAGMWVRCAGYASMAARYPELPGDNEVREEGTACHWLAYEYGNNRLHPVGTIAPNGVEITDEMIEAVGEYLGLLRGWGVPVYLECEVAVPSVHAECGGTVDAWGWDAANRVLYVADLKFGYNPVEPFENWRLLCYVRGVIDFLQAQYGKFTEHFTVVMTIFQPRGYGHDAVKTWRTNTEKLRPYMTQLTTAAVKAVAYRDGVKATVCGDTGGLTAGPHCYYCSAAANCKTLQTASLQLIDVSTDHGSMELDAHQAAAELRRLDHAIETMKARQSSLEGKVQHSIQREGVVHQFFEVSSGKGSVRFREDAKDEVIALGKLFGKDLTKPVALITPLQAAAFMPPGMLDSYKETRSGKLKLRRLAANHASKLFDQE